MAAHSRLKNFTEDETHHNLMSWLILTSIYFPQSSYDMELQALQEMIQEKVVMLLNDPDNSVKRTLLDNGITRLCVFFGRQKG